MKNVLKFLKNHIHLSTIVDKGAPKKLIPSSFVLYKYEPDIPPSKIYLLKASSISLYL